MNQYSAYVRSAPPREALRAEYSCASIPSIVSNSLSGPLRGGILVDQYPAYARTAPLPVSENLRGSMDQYPARRTPLRGSLSKEDSRGSIPCVCSESSASWRTPKRGFL